MGLAQRLVDHSAAGGAASFSSLCLGGMLLSRGEVWFESGELCHSERDGRDRGGEEKRLVLVA